MSPVHALVRSAALLAAQRALIAHFGPRRALSVTRRAGADHATRCARHDGPESLTASYAIMVAALYRAALQERATPAQGRALAAAMTRALFLPAAALSWSLLGRLPGGLRARVQRSNEAMRRALFTAPSFAYDDVEAGDGVVAFDIQRCPFAEHLRAEGLVELGSEAICAIDHELAAARGLRLERTQTLLTGAARCDFRWVLPAERLVRRAG
jgi:hypothetical protein